MTGQEAANLVKSFNDEIGITGAVLTKMDGDTRGGAALTIREVSGRPIKFTGRHCTLRWERSGDLIIITSPCRVTLLVQTWESVVPESYISTATLAGGPSSIRQRSYQMS